MIQFNLLPDVKLEYIKTQRNKRLVFTVAAIVTAVSLLILIVLTVLVFGFQRKYIADLTSDIKTQSSNLQGTGELDKVLTIQNQLNSLTGLHQQKEDASRIIPFIQKITPANVSIASLDVNYTTPAMTISGTAPNLAAVNTFVDTLKFTNVTYGETKAKAFSQVVLSGFGSSEDGATYSITLAYDAAMFKVINQVNLEIPSQITTRSETEKPSALFKTQEDN